MLPPLAVAHDFIAAWEGGYSVDRHDSGNWTGAKVGVGRLTGSEHGVTPQTLAAARGVPVSRVTAAMIRSVTLDQAAQIAVDLFWHGPGLDRLPWEPVTAPLLDLAWMAGPERAAFCVQRVVGAPSTGQFDPVTVQAYLVWRSGQSPESAATAMLDARDAYFHGIAHPGSMRSRFLSGWLRRTAYYRPSGAWWKRVQA